jgi:hypothetical protein
MVTARRTRYVLVLEPLPNVDAVKALRFALKSLLRRAGMKCVDIHEADDKDATAPARIPQLTPAPSPLVTHHEMV